MGDRINNRFKSLVTRQRDPDLMLSRGHQHASTYALKLANVPHEKSVEKNSRSGWIDCNLDFGLLARKNTGRGFIHDYANHLLLPRLEHDALGEILITILAHSNYVFPW